MLFIKIRSQSQQQSQQQSWPLGCPCSTDSLLAGVVKPIVSQVQCGQWAVENRIISMENTIWRVSRSARIARRREWCQQKAAHLFGRTAARAAAPSFPISLPQRLRLVSGLLKIEKLAWKTQYGAYLGQHGSHGNESGARRKLLTCLVELPPKLWCLPPQYCCK